MFSIKAIERASTAPTNRSAALTTGKSSIADASLGEPRPASPTTFSSRRLGIFVPAHYKALFGYSLAQLYDAIRFNHVVTLRRTRLAYGNDPYIFDHMLEPFRRYDFADLIRRRRARYADAALALVDISLTVC
jgi:hypothetical protein